MAIGYHHGNYTQQFNSTYNITLDLSGWDKMTMEVFSPVFGTLIAQGTNDGGGVFGVSYGNANTATNFFPVQVKNLLTGTSSPYIYGAGLYQYDVNAKYFRLQGSPAAAGTSLYRISMFNSKID